MAESRRGFIFGAFFLSLLCVVSVVLSLSTGSWVISTASFPPVGGIEDNRPNHIRYGLFGGHLETFLFASPATDPLYMQCVLDVNACAVSCKTTADARREEVRAMANGFRTNVICSQTTIVDENNPLERPAVISAVFYIILVTVLGLQLLFAVIATVLAFVNATRNPTEPILGLPGVLWSNIVTAVLGTTVLLMWGIYWAVTYLQDHLAFSYTAMGSLIPYRIGLGFSYWLLLVSVVLSLINIALVELRRYLLEKDPKTPAITVDHQSDGTIFIY